MLLVQSFSEPLLTEGVIQLHKNLWEAGGSKTGPWLNEGKFTQLPSLGTHGPTVSSLQCAEWKPLPGPLANWSCVQSSPYKRDRNIRLLIRSPIRHTLCP